MAPFLLLVLLALVQAVRLYGALYEGLHRGSQPRRLLWDPGREPQQLVLEPYQVVGEVAVEHLQALVEVVVVVEEVHPSLAVEAEEEGFPSWVEEAEEEGFPS